tara:strand:- start:173 stop:1603 length:1431 start_codon:yes stop_codon:yes gene_type:complete
MPVSYVGTTFQNPTPKVSVTKEFVKAGDGTIIGQNYQITLTGDIISTAALTTTGAGQSDLMSRLKDTFTVGKLGTLEVSPYGGLGGAFTFPNASVASVDIPEPSDESMWIQDAQYSITCEADYESGDPLFAYQVQDVSETWDLQENEGVLTFDTSSDTPYKTYTLTHTVEATGRRKMSSGTVTNDAWKEAEIYVKALCGDSPTNVNLSEMPGGTSALNVKQMGSTSTSSINADTLNAYNHIRVQNVNKGAGSFSQTDTWTLGKVNATQELEISVETSATEGDFNVSISGTITGLMTEVASETSKTRASAYTNALALLPSDSDLYTLANALYTGGGTLLTAPLGKSVGHNKVSGIITYSLTFNDRLSPALANSLSTNINVESSNADGSESVFASIPVIGRALGPVLQQMGTTGERKQRVSIEAVMKKAYRTNPPSADAKALALTYIPTGTTVIQGPISQTWQPSNGSYSLNVEWTYQ